MSLFLEAIQEYGLSPILLAANRQKHALACTTAPAHLPTGCEASSSWLVVLSMYPVR
jgi:hypothetical protein